MRQWRSTLFYSQEMRWNAHAVIAARTKDDAMGGRSWAALQFDSERDCRAFMLWANSTLGMMVHWTRGSRTDAGQSTGRVGAITKMPCPRLSDLPSDQLDFAVRRYQELERKELLDACQAHADPGRHEIDDAVCRMFGWPDSIAGVIKRLRYRWCREPSVHGGHKEALDLLQR